MKQFTCHWQFKYWIPAHNPPGVPIAAAGSNKFLDRGVKPGHVLYMVSLSNGLLYLGGRMTVDRIVSRAAAVRILGNEDLYEDADEWALGSPSAGTPLVLDRLLDPNVTALLRFISPSGEVKHPSLKGPGKLDNQATRSVREVTPCAKPAKSEDSPKQQRLAGWMVNSQGTGQSLRCGGTQGSWFKSEVHTSESEPLQRFLSA